MRTVLVVDDDPDVLGLLAELLIEDGFWVLQASSGDEALRILERDVEIHLLVTDVVMPGGIDGLELAARAKMARPDLRVLYVSGYVPGAGAWPKQAPLHGKLLGKPWRAAELKREVQAAVGPGKSS